MVLRTATRPRWLALLVLVLVLASAFAALGNWQLGRAQRDDGRGTVPTQPVPIAEVAAPQQQLDGDAVAGQVRITGTYEPDRLLVVTERQLGGRDGGWVVVPLVETPGGLGDGSGNGSGGLPSPARLAVVLGFTADLDPAGTAARVAAALPSGVTELVGRLQPSQGPSGPTGDLLPGQVRSLSSAELVDDWRPPVYSGFLLAAEAPAGLAAVPAPGPEEGLDILNVSYALQWWVFAVFAVFLWWRVVRDAHADEMTAASASSGTYETGEEPAQTAVPARRRPDL